MPDLSIQVQEIREVPGTAIVQIGGSIDAKTVIQFQNELSAVRQKGISRFVLDMENVKYINSTGLGYLINLADSVGPAQGAVALVKVQPKVKVVFDMLGLNAFFKIHPTRKEALQQLAQGAGAAPAGAETAPASVASKAASSSAGPVTVSAQGGIECQVCRATLVVNDPGTYKCPRCSTVFMYQGDRRANFLARRKMSPVQLSLTCTDECLDGLAGFVHALGRKAGLSTETTRSFEMAVRDTVETLREHAFGGNAYGTFHVLLLAADSELELRIADSGKSIADNGQTHFSLARQVMDRFEHRPHPKGGNLLTLAKKTSPAR